MLIHVFSTCIKACVLILYERRWSASGPSSTRSSEVWRHLLRTWRAPGSAAGGPLHDNSNDSNSNNDHDRNDNDSNNDSGDNDHDNDDHNDHNDHNDNDSDNDMIILIHLLLLL